MTEININWGLEVARWDCKVIGRIEITPGVIFTIRKTNTLERSKDGTLLISYHVDYDMWGCTCGEVFKDRAECEAYLKTQVEKAPQYAALGAKRDALAARMRPLQKKWSQNSEQLFALAKA